MKRALIITVIFILAIALIAGFIILARYAINAIGQTYQPTVPPTNSDTEDIQNSETEQPSDLSTATEESSEKATSPSQGTPTDDATEPEDDSPFPDWIYAGAPEIDESKFANPESKYYKTVEEGITNLAAGVFTNNKNLRSVKLPSTLKKINKNAFSGCTSLESIVIPEGVTEIEAGAFWECSNLETIYFPTTLTTFGEDVFDACDGLKQVVIPNNVKVISPFLFFNCKYLKEISLPASIEVLGKSCFAYCIRLNTVYYMGTIEQWNAIEKEDTWSDGTRGFNVICTDGKIEY